MFLNYFLTFLGLIGLCDYLTQSQHHGQEVRIYTCGLFALLLTQHNKECVFAWCT